MNFDEYDQDNPLSGKGEEMVPERGIPFEDEDLQDMLADFETNETPVEVSEDQLSALMGATNSDMDDRDGGMNAAFPMAPDDDFMHQPEPPQEEIALPLHEDMEVEADLGGGAAMSMAAPSFAPGLGSMLDQAGSRHLDAKEIMLATFVTEERLQMLWHRMDDAQRTVRDTVPNIEIASGMLEQIERARNEFLADKDNYEEVEHLLGEVELRLVVIARAKKEHPTANKLFVYEVAWAIVFGLILLALRASYTRLDPETVVIFFSMALGGLGSVVRAIYTLWQHTSKELNFSKQYSMWYITHPIIGPFLGIFVFLIMRQGALTDDTSSAISSPYTIYLLSFLIGFQQNIALKLMRRLQQVFFPDAGE